MEPKHHIITQTSSRILGEAAFIFADAMSQELIPSLDTWNATGVSIEFTGNSSGRIHLWATPEFCRIAAANMLGIDGDNEGAEKKSLDAMKELLNMTAGNFLTEAYGNEPVFHLGLPELLPGSQLALDFNDPEAIWISAEGNPVMLLIKEIVTQ